MIQSDSRTASGPGCTTADCAVARPGSTGVRGRSRVNAAGFSMIELVVTVGIVSALMSVAILVMPGALKQARADGSVSEALNALRLARDRAVGERRNMAVVLTTPDHIEVVRQELNGNPNTTVIDVYLENGQKFQYFTVTGDTLDGFGLTNKPLAFGATQGTVEPIMFTSEGTLINGSGDPTNGTIFLGTPNDPSSARAVTIFGATGLLRVWKWNGAKWIE